MATYPETSVPKPRSRFKKFITTFLIIVIVVLLGFLWWNYLFVFGEGVKIRPA
jgi:UDP-N-acetylmuramyl pentapeptide phosphotransferase/UDP-N-acetylglucosamine-1-phosphate transferase